MSSKLEYLQRYMAKGSDTTEKKLKKKRKKDKAASGNGASLRIVDGDHDWTQEAPARGDIEDKWENDAAEDEAPVVVANGEIDPEDLPVIANAHEYEEELQAKRKKPAEKEPEEDASPPRRRQRDSNAGDASPPRRRAAAEEDASPPRRSAKRKDSDDASPPRRGRRAMKDSDGESPPRRRAARPAKDSDDDASPPRRSKATQDNDDASPPRRSRGKQSDGDLPSKAREETRERSAQATRSPERDSRSRRRSSPSRSRDRRERRGSSRSRTRRDPSRQSPSRSRGRSRGAGSSRRRSPSRSADRRSRRRRRSSSPRDRRSHRRSTSRDRDDRRNQRRRSRSRSASRERSPPRPSGRATTKREDDDASPTRKQRKVDDREKETKPLVAAAATKPAVGQADNAETKDEYKPRAGLFTAEEFAEDLKRKTAHNDILRGATAEDMGHKAETVYRDKKGRKLDMLNELVRQQEVLDGQRKQEARDQYEWGTGRVQKEEKLNEQQLMEKMKRAPFARRNDDEELEQMRRERVRAFDPIHSKVFQDDSLLDELPGGAKTSKTHKSKTKQKTKHAGKPKYAGPPAPPNRFGISPGYRWDGVVRGTGWEEKLMLRANTQNAQSDEAYRYATADM